MSSFKDYYKILNINFSASITDIKKAYKIKMREFHPDISKQSDSNENSALLNEAYEILSDIRTRNKYDEKYKIINFL